MLIDKAENNSESKSPHYAGIGRVITATTLGISTDLFGEMPFSDIFEDQKFNFYSRSNISVSYLPRFFERINFLS